MSKRKVMMVFSEGGENGGPFVSHKRIIESSLEEEFNFVKLYIPKGRLRIFNIKLFKYLTNEIKKEKPDVIQVPGLQLQGFHTMIAAFFCRVPCRIVAIHGSSLESTSFSKIKKCIMRILEDITLFLSTDFFGVSDYVSSWKRLKKFKKKSIGTIYNLPPKINELKNQNGKIRKELNISDEKIVITTTSRITKEKGFDTLKDVIKGIKNKNVCFLIVGDGDFLSALKNELNEEIIRKKVYFLGYRSDIMDILNDSDIFILLSHHETLSISLLEAAQMKLPLIATNVGGIPEIITNGVNGYLVENYNVKDTITKINALTENNDEYILMKTNSEKIFLKKFNRLRILKQLRKLYNGEKNE